MKIELEWNDVLKQPPEIGQPVLGYSPEWEDEDFNVSGMRECFLMDDGCWLSAKWDNDADCWRTDKRSKPTLWMSPQALSPSGILKHGVKGACHVGDGWELYDAKEARIEDWPEGWPESVNAAWLRSRGVEVL